MQSMNKKKYNTQHNNDNLFLIRLTNEIELMLELQICFKLGNNTNKEIEYLFPSLGATGLYLLILFYFLPVV